MECKTNKKVVMDRHILTRSTCHCDLFLLPSCHWVFLVVFRAFIPVVGWNLDQVHHLENSVVTCSVANPTPTIVQVWCLNMLSATLTFAQTHHCDITETILCYWEVANLSKAKGKIRPGWHLKDTLNTVIFKRKQYHLIIMRDQNRPPLWPICWTG